MQRQGFTEKLELKISDFAVRFIFLLKTDILSLAFQVIQVLLLSLSDKVF